MPSIIILFPAKRLTAWLNIANGALCFTVFAVYLYASGIPQYNQTTWEAGVEVESMLAWPNVEVDFSLPKGMFIDTQGTIAVLQDPLPTSNWSFHLTKLSNDAAQLTAYTFTLNSSQLPPLNVA